MNRSKLTVAVALLGAVGLSACTDPVRFQDENGQANQTQKGAIIGGLVGATVGALAADDNKFETAALAGAAGALVGGTIGHELDQQAAELRQTLSNDISIVNTGDRLIVSLPNDLTFASGSAQVSSAVRADLLKVADSLVRYPSSSVQVIGHTDSDGDAGYNQGLSERRANSVADLIQAGGVPFNRIFTQGRGENQPVASNLTPEGKQANRRVEIVVIPNAA